MIKRIKDLRLFNFHKEEHYQFHTDVTISELASTPSAETLLMHAW